MCDPRDLVSDNDFYDWLVGFIDAEGNFTIKVSENKFSIQFLLKIDLHLDDKSVLEYVCKRLQIGTVGIYESSSIVRWVVTKSSDLDKLIAILNKRTLNTTKYLDYLKWLEAINLWRQAKLSPNTQLGKSVKLATRTKILELKAGMNKNKTSFFPIANHEIIITPYWFLGFLEGDGSFGINTLHFSTIFSLEQRYTEKPVLIAIAEYLKGLIPTHLSELKDRQTLVTIFDTPARSERRKPTTTLAFTHLQFLFEVIVPFFDNLTFFSFFS